MKYSAPPQLGEMRALYIAGMSTYAIGQKFGTNGGTVHYWLKQAGVIMRAPTNKKGSSNKKAKKTALPPRPCIRCQSPFRPRHKFNRLCDRCSKYINDNNSSSLAPGW